MQQAQVADVDRQAIYTHFPPPSSGLGMGLLPDQVEPCAQTSKIKWSFTRSRSSSLGLLFKSAHLFIFFAAFSKYALAQHCGSIQFYHFGI